MLGVRAYLHVVAMAEDVETLQEWISVQAAIHRQDEDVVDVTAHLVTDDELGQPRVQFVEI